MESIERHTQDLLAALSRLAAKGLAGDSRARFSLRVPGGDAMIGGLAESGTAPGGAMLVPLRGEADGDWAFHAAVYRLRADVGAMVTACLPWTSRLARLCGEMPAAFDEQARYLGRRVERLSFEGAEPTAAGARIIRRGGNAFVSGDEAVCLGFDKNRAIFNTELLEKSAQAYVLATLSGLPVRRIPFYVRYIAARRLHADRKRAAAGSPC